MATFKEKRNVFCESYLDGRLLRRWAERRMVYWNETDARAWVVVMGNKKWLDGDTCETHAHQVMPADVRA
jgi:hypothetical protein